ncbi:MAG: general secretion pathway protein GspB [Pseudomonadota bacterium]|nr:general secretion pathway protein GspB [Pseudomonadota bacterium]
MSMILDAIKRSKEAPEGGGSVPSLDTEHYVAPDQPIWKKAVFKLGSLATVGVMVVVLTVWYSSDPDGSDTSVANGGDSVEGAAEEKVGDAVAVTSKDIASNARSQTPSTSSIPVSGSSAQDKSSQRSSGDMRGTRPIIIPIETQPAKNSGPNVEALSSLYAAMNEEAVATLDSPTASEAQSEAASDAVDQATEVSEASDGVEDGSAVDFAEILAQAQKELGVQPLVDSSEPLLETLSQQTKDQIPSLIYSEHNYSANGRSEVVLNGQSLTERQRAGPFTVVEILPDSVILRWRETQFRVRARNSWINM